MTDFYDLQRADQKQRKLLSFLKKKDDRHGQEVLWRGDASNLRRESSSATSDREDFQEKE